MSQGQGSDVMCDLNMELPIKGSKVTHDICSQDLETIVSLLPLSFSPLMSALLGFSVPPSVFICSGLLSAWRPGTLRRHHPSTVESWGEQSCEPIMLDLSYSYLQGPALMVQTSVIPSVWRKAKLLRRVRNLRTNSTLATLLSHAVSS